MPRKPRRPSAHEGPRAPKDPVSGAMDDPSSAMSATCREYPRVARIYPMRSFLVIVATVLGVWALGYLSYAISNSVPATGPAEHVRELGSDGGSD